MHNIYLIPITDMNFHKLISRISKFLSTQNGRQEGLDNKVNSKKIVGVTKE